MGDAASQRLLLYGDQMDNMVPCIRNLSLQSKKSVLLRNYLQGCCDVLKVQLASLNPDYRKIPAFDSILAFAEQHDKSDRSSLFASAVLCYIGRIGELIIYSENDPSILTSDLTVIGLCLGLFPAAVGSVARDATELVDLGLEILPAVVRIAVAGVERAREIEDSEGTWSYVVRDIPDDELKSSLDEFHQTHSIPQHRLAFLSVLGPSWSTLSGPPSTLTSLIQWSPVLKDKSLIPMPVHGLAHAPHLPPIDVDFIVGDSPSLERIIPERVNVISTSTCERYTSKSLRELLVATLRDGFDRPLRLIDTVMATLVAMFGGGDIHITCIGPTMQLRSLEKGMQQAGIEYSVTKKAEIHDRSRPRGGSGLIAIVGMAGRFPQSEDVAAFWDLILKGTDTHTTIPEKHFPLKDFYDPTNKKKNSTSAKHGCFLDNPGLFDTRLFNVSPREAMQMDPIQRLLLMTTHEALENSGFSADSSPSTDSSRVAVYVGQCTEQWRDIAAVHGVDIFSVQGLLRAFTPGRLNYHFKFEGPSYSVDAACSSSSTSIALACSALVDRNCDMALAGGAQLSNTPLEFSGLSIAGFLSSTGNCKTFRADANGYCRGEGVGMVVLKRLEDAIAENDNIQAVISGWGRNHSANAISITHPHAQTQERLYHQVLQQASLDPFDITYVEMHGTGTQAGDSVEMKSVTNVFAGAKRTNNPLYVGAVKANVGHSEAAAGVTAVLKASMMLQTGLVPPQVGADQPLNPAFPPLDDINVRIPINVSPLKPSPSGDGKTRVLVNNFDAAGGNTCLVLEEAPAKREKIPDERQWHVVTVSGRTLPALTGNKRRLLEYLLTHPETKFGDLGYSTTARRMHEVWRSALVGNSIQQVIKLLQDSLQKEDAPRRSFPKANAVFVFTGQGSQYSGMGHELYRSIAQFANKIDALQKLASYLGLPIFKDIVADPATKLEGRSTVDVQLATVCLEVALAGLWMSWGIKPTAVLGHSLGEYAALCISGVLSESDMLLLVGRRALLIQEKVTTGEYAMLSVAATIDQVRENIVAGGYGSSCQVSCYNAPQSIVLSGKIDKLKEFDHLLHSKGLRTKLLEVPYGFHSPQLDPILEDFEKISQAAVFATPSIPVVSTLTGELVRDKGVFSPSYLMQQARQPVRFEHALRSLQSANLTSEHTVYIESGPHAVCTTFLKATLDLPKERLLPSLRSGEPAFKTIANSMQLAYLVGLPVNWAEFHREHHQSVSLLALPTYAFDTREFWDVYQYETMPGLGGVALDSVKAINAPDKVSFSTTGLQRIVSQEVKGDEVSVVFESATAEEKLHEAIHGHIVNGAALCPTSVFSDMASGAAKYIWGLAASDKPTPFGALRDLDIFNALVVPTDAGTQAIRVAATAASKNGDVHITFSSGSGNGNYIDNGKCVVRASDGAKSKAEWSRLTPMVKARIDALMDPTNDDVVRLQRRFIYKLFNAVVKYDEKYHGLHALHMDEDVQDAVGIIRLQPLDGTGKWSISPYWSDTIVHLAGFVMNGSSQNPEDMAHISGGLDCMSLADELTDQKEYYSYVRMRPAEKKGASIGDVYILDGSEIVGFCEGVKFQQMKKSILNIVLGISGPEVTTQAHNHVSTAHGVHPASAATPGAVKASAAPASGDEDSQADEVIEALISAILSETGFDPSELDDSTALLDMGVDSLMSIAIIDAVKRNTGITLPVSFFMDITTIGDINSKRTSSNGPPSDSGDSGDSSASSSLNAIATTATTPFETYVEEALDLSKYFSKAVLVQGSESSTKTPLFLICDGAGSASAYMYIPKLPSGTPVYALESPFLRNPFDFSCSCEEVSTLYKNAARTVQPTGPYMIGGWSAGAVFAYEVSRQLLVEGEEVSGLLLIDMKVPRRNMSIIAPTLDVVEQANLVTRVHGERVIFDDLTSMVKQHLLASSLCVRKYEPLPMPEERRPTNGTFIIWARSGLCDTMRNPDEVEEVSRGLSIDPIGKNVMYDNDIDMRTFLFSKRYHFGVNGWDSLVGDAEAVVIDGDHFSIVRKPHVSGLGQGIQSALDKFTT